MEKKIILPLDEIEVADGEMIMIRGGISSSAKSGESVGAGCGCGCDNNCGYVSGRGCGCDNGCGCISGRGCGCECGNGSGCGCGCVKPDPADKPRKVYKV